MALEHHNTAFEFETMLRRHLSQGGSMVEACVGFDADTASAYLENALGQPARTRYESHLAGCPACRRSVIELSRLADLPQAFPQAESRPVAAAAPPSAWSNWKTTLTGLFDASGWKWGWATAGAAAAVLLAVVATPVWRHSGQTESAAIPLAISSTPLPSLPSAPSDAQISAESAIAGTVAARDAGQVNQQPQSPVSAGVPKPEVSALTSAPQMPTVAASDSMKTIESGKGYTQPGATAPPNIVLPVPTNTNAPLVASFRGDGINQQMAVSYSPPAVPAPEQPVLAAETARIIAPINPSPSDNPMTRSRGPKPTPTPSIVGSFSFAPSRKAEAGQKLQLKEIEEGAPKLLTVRVRDKIFSFQSGMWVDHAYKPEMAWRVIKLVRDSEQYDQVLAAEPQLKEFFERSAVIVVWKDKIYKVVSK